MTRGEEYAIFDALEAKNTSAVLDLIHDKKGINAVDAVRLSGVDRDLQWGRYWERKDGWGSGKGRLMPGQYDDCKYNLCVCLCSTVRRR